MPPLAPADDELVAAASSLVEAEDLMLAGSEMLNAVVDVGLTLRRPPLLLVHGRERVALLVQEGLPLHEGQGVVAGHRVPALGLHLPRHFILSLDSIITLKSRIHLGPSVLNIGPSVLNI